MVAFPDTQARAQAEIEEVIGRARPPSFADMPHLKYVQAMVKEVLRWRQSLPFAVPHVATEDDWYGGMFIPKGCTVIANQSVCNLDPAVYGPDAHLFDPARHLDANGDSVVFSETKSDGHSAFGFGRRACVGRYIAADSLFIAVATILWAMNIEPARDGAGRPIHVDPNGRSGNWITK